jgi:hypothetical protein
VTKPVVYNGQTNSFSGKGTPNPKLTIPQKDKMGPAVLAMALAIEQWCNNVVAPAAGYASLTGPGQTVTPGELDQAGSFWVNADPGGWFGVYSSVSGAGSFIMNTAVGDGITMSIPTSGTITLSTAGNANTAISDTGSGGITIISVFAGVLVAAEGATLTLQAGTGIQLQAKGGGASGDQVAIFTNQGNPNGVVTPANKGDLCIDVSTPGLWQSPTGSGTVWTAL